MCMYILFQGGLTALMEAAYSNQYESVDILLENGAIADMQDDVGYIFIDAIVLFLSIYL